MQCYTGAQDKLPLEVRDEKILVKIMKIIKIIILLFFLLINRNNNNVFHNRLYLLLSPLSSEPPQSTNILSDFRHSSNTQSSFNLLVILPNFPPRHKCSFNPQ